MDNDRPGNRPSPGPSGRGRRPAFERDNPRVPHSTVDAQIEETVGFLFVTDEKHGLPDADLLPSAVFYDLRRGRLKGLILRLPGTYRYVVTTAGRTIALFFQRTFARVLRRGLARLDAPPPIEPPDPRVTAWRRLDQALDHLVRDARLAA